MDSDAVSSSPAPAVFSDEVACSTPPSSPPGFPWEKKTSEDQISKQSVITKSAFSVLGKRKALEAVSENARPAKKAALPLAAPGTNKSLTQMQISLGQEVQKKCKTCGMEYVLSSNEDRKLHDKYHKQNTEGFDLGKDFVQNTLPTSTFAGAHPGDVICALDCWDKPARKRRGQAALEVVQRELGAVEIPERSIWDLKESEPKLGPDPKYRAYLYVRGSKCIGYVLIQKITEAYAVIEPAAALKDAVQPTNSSDRKNALVALKARQQAEADRLSQPIEAGGTKRPAQIGISRIWTSANFRHQNIATRLLDTALEHHNRIAERQAERFLELGEQEQVGGIWKDVKHVLEVTAPKMEAIQNKDMIAFSQPTTSGTRLARRWFGKPYGWSVYLD